MNLQDIPAAFAIEQKVFYSRWNIETFENELGSKNGYYLKAQIAERIVGYAGSQLVLDEAHITALAVDPDFQRRGIGEKLIGTLLDDLKGKEVKHYSLEVRSSNQKAQSLYAKLGFQVMAVRKDYYAHPREDALLMVLDLE